MKSAEGPAKFSPIASASLSITLFICLLLLMIIAAFIEFTIPSTEYLAREYLDHVRQGNLKSVKQLAGDSEFCQKIVFDQAQRDFGYIGNADLRNLKIIVKPTNGSSDTIEFAKISFAYTNKANGKEGQGEIILATDHKTFGFRYICSEINIWSEYS